MKIAAFDLSLRAPGFMAGANGPQVMKVPKFDGAELLNWFYTTFVQGINGFGLVIFENYSFGSKFSREPLAELGGVARLACFQNGIPYVAIAPTTAKKYATGSGKATKDEMLSSAIKRSGFDITNNNAADAWWLYQMGAAHYGLPDAVEMPKENRKSLEKIQWPDLEGK